MDLALREGESELSEDATILDKFSWHQWLWIVATMIIVLFVIPEVFDLRVRKYVFTDRPIYVGYLRTSRLISFTIGPFFYSAIHGNQNFGVLLVQGGDI